MHNKSKFDNITEKNKNHIDSIFRTETSRDPKGVTNPLWSLDTSPLSGVFVRERGTRVKDRRKTGASKIPFLVLSLLQNQTEKLATQANATPKSTTISSSSNGGLYSVSSQIMTIGINYGRYMVTIFYWAAC